MHLATDNVICINDSEQIRISSPALIAMFAEIKKTKMKSDCCQAVIASHDGNIGHLVTVLTATAQ